jgi:predicted O-methyltransferase YrrM
MIGPIQSLFKNRPFTDYVFCHLLRQRMKLPKLSLAALFDNFDMEPVTITKLARGRWSTPLADVVLLLKLATCTRPKRTLEMGSFRGYTALLLAQHTDADASIVTVDSYPEHGEAYRNTPFASKVERRVGEIGTAIFAGDKPQSYDLIFVDSGHLYSDVKRDTKLILPLVSQSGYVVWHDYANWGYFNGQNGVPDYLCELAATGLPLAHIAGTQLAIHSPDWGLNSASRSHYEKAINKYASEGVGESPWKSEIVRA